jgi:uncharacterized protein (DUF58 family)
VADVLRKGPDRTGRSLRPRPAALGLLGIGSVAGIAALATRGTPQTILAIALIGAVAFDGWAARAALARADLGVTNPMDAVAGQLVRYVVTPRGLRRPIQLVRPSQWPLPTPSAIALDAPDAGLIELPAPGRSVVTCLVFDLVATGPLGLWDATCRIRTWFPAPLAVGPASLPHDPDWPRLRTVRLGDTETVVRGDDLFRGVRPYVRGDPRRSVHWPATAHHGSVMVKERDGLEQVALRVVLQLPMPGPASEYAAARAAFLVDEGLRWGWLVHLVTVEPAAGPPPQPPLARPYGPVPLPWAVPTPGHTVEQRIHHPGLARQQLARAGFGVPALDEWVGLTRIVSPDGDQWR